MLHIEERPRGSVMVLAFSGNISAGAPETQFGDRIRHVLFRGYRKLLLDLSKVTSSDAAGVSAFLGALSDARLVGADIKLVHVTRRLSNLLIIVALYRYFSVFDCEDDAFNSFGVESGASSGTRTASQFWLRPALAS